VKRLRLSCRRLGFILSAVAVPALLGGACGSDNGYSPTATAVVSTAATSPANTATTVASTVASSTPTVAPAANTPSAALIKVGTSAKGNVLTDSAGLSLYTFDNDTAAGKSACNGGCANAWPSMTTAAAAPPSGISGASGAFSLITRDDGAKQVAYNGKPLYRYAADAGPGGTAGDGVGNVWHLAKP